MKINKKSIIKRIESRKVERGPISLYLDKGLFRRFQKVCGALSASEVVEELMRDFVEQG